MDDQNPQSNPLPVTPPAQTVLPVQASANQPPPPAGPPPSKSFLSGKLIILIVILLVILAGGGAYFALSSKPKVQPETQTVPTSTPTPTVDPTTSWKTYTGQFVTFKYPARWNPSNALLFGGLVLENIELGIPGIESDQTLGFSGVDFQDFQNIKPSDITQETAITVDGKKGFKWVRKGQNYVSYDYYTSGQNNKGYFGVHVTAGSENKDLEKELDTLVSYIKFTDAGQTTDTSTWKTYTNAKGKYSLQYPPTSTFTEDASGNATASLSNNKVVIATEPITLSLNNYIDQKTWCVSISSTTGKAFNLNSESSLRFDKTPCGSTGSTDIYSVHNGIAYHIFIETQENFDTVRPIFDQILSTFKFTQ